MELPKATLVAFKDENHAPEEREPILRRAYLYRLRGAKREFGNRYYVTLDGTSRTWLTDEKAEMFKLTATLCPNPEE